jgi:hypothetical protein
LRQRLHNQKNLIVIDVGFHIEPHNGSDEETEKQGTWWTLN